MKVEIEFFQSNRDALAGVHLDLFGSGDLAMLFGDFLQTFEGKA